MSSEATTPTPALESIPDTASAEAFGSSLDAFFAQADAELMGAVSPDPATAPDPAPSATPDPDPAAENTPAASDDAQTDPLDGVDDLKDWTPQAARRFKEIKAEAKAAKLRAAELEQQIQQNAARLQELEALNNDPKIKDLTSRAEEYENAMILRDLENSHVYRTLVSEPLEQITAQIDALADKYSLSGDDLIEAVVMDDEAAQEERLGELLVNASDRDKFRLYKLIEETKPVLEQRAALKANAREALHEVQELERQRQQETLAEVSRTRAAAAQEVAKRIETKLPFLTSFEGLDLSRVTELAGTTDYTKLDPAIGTYNTMAGHLLPKMASAYIALKKELSVLTDKLAEYDHASSPLNGGHAAATAARPASTSQGSFLEAVEAAFSGR